jgi:hypothetical protein
VLVAHCGLHLGACVSALKFRWEKEAIPAFCLAPWIRSDHWNNERRGNARILTWNRDVSSCDSCFCKRCSLREWIGPAKGIGSRAIPMGTSEPVASFPVWPLAMYRRGWAESLRESAFLPNQPCEHLLVDFSDRGPNYKRTNTVCHISEPDNPNNPVVPLGVANGIGRHFHAQPQNRFLTYLVLRSSE